LTGTGYIITGGPGSGKSTLLEALRKEGFSCYSEVSRELIKEQAHLPDGVLPWNNMPAFARLAFDAMLRQHDKSLSSMDHCFFDRGLPDIFGYLEEGRHTVPPEYIEAHERCRYQRRVFILPPWQDIFINDSERPQTFEQSVKLYRTLRLTYMRLGYELHEVPKTSVADRVEYLLSRIGYIRN
jgi:predicted ATPase